MVKAACHLSLLLLSTLYSPYRHLKASAASWLVIFVVFPSVHSLRNSPLAAFSSCVSPIPTPQMIQSDQVVFSLVMALLWGGTLVEVPSPALGRRKKWGKSLPSLPTPYPLFSEPHPTPPGFLDLKISPESYLASHTERKERKEKKESKEIATLIFLKLQLKTPPTPQWSQFLWSHRLCFVLDLFSECLVIEHGVVWKEVSERSLELALEIRGLPTIWLWIALWNSFGGTPFAMHIYVHIVTHQSLYLGEH